MRLEMSKRSDLTLRAIRHLAYAEDAVDGSQLAEAIGTTTHFLPQVLRPAVRAGWIDSTPGRGGGYRLAADLNEISVLDLIAAVEGTPEDGRCVLRGVPCPAEEACVLHDSWVRARAALLAELGSTSLATALLLAPTKGE